MASSWSDLPLDLLISIGNKLLLGQRSDVNSFRLVCSQWHSAVPIPSRCPCYSVCFDYYNNIINFTLESNNDSNSNHFLSLPFFSSSLISFLCPSNGWLVFKSNNNKSLHLFDPVSNRKHIFPPLHRQLFRRYNRGRPTPHKESYFLFQKVVVSSSLDPSIAAACIVSRSAETIPAISDKMLVFCRHVNGFRQRWSLLMAQIKAITDIALAGDGRFYAIGEDWELYLLDERPQLIRLKRFKLCIPKHNLEIDQDYLPPEKCLSVLSNIMTDSGEIDLKIYASYWRYMHEGVTISLKINVAKLRGLNNFNVTCDSRWSYFDKFPSYYRQYFTPSLKEYHSK